MKKLASWTASALLAALATATPAHASWLQEVGSPFPAGTAPDGVLTANFDGDPRGLPDVLAVNGTSSTATLLLRQPLGGFKQEAAVTSVAAGPNFPAVADFNGDGLPDFASGGYAPGGLSVLLRNPSGGFVNANGSPYAATRVGAVAAGNFGGTSLPDIAVVNYLNSGATIYVQQVGGTFVAQGALPTGINPRYIATADFNGDGLTDLAIANMTVGAANGSVTILLQKAGGAFEQENGSPIKVGAEPVMIATADLNGDGRPDLAVANSKSNNVTLLARQAGGGFAQMPESPVAVGALPFGVVAADFDHDGRNDLAVTNYNDSTVSVLLRNPSGGFTHDQGSPVPTGVHPYSLATADFNLDGKPDLAISNEGSGNITVLLNTTPDPIPPGFVQPIVTPPAVTPIAKVPAPAIDARLTLGWTVYKKDLLLTSATIKDLPKGGATVKIVCKACHVNQTIKAKKTSQKLSKLGNRHLKRGASFTITVTKPGYVGQVFTRKVKNYGRTLKELKKARNDPFNDSLRCIPVGSTKPVKTC